jgi:hypothetical protein
VTLAALKASLALHRRRYSWARGDLAKFREKAKSGTGGHTPGVVTRVEAEEIKRLEKRVADELALIERRKKQIAERSGGGKPPIITSAQLGLSFQYVWGGKGTHAKLAGHYTAGHRSANATQLAAEMRADHAFHRSKGWGGLSYEAMIADDGTIGFGNPTDRLSAAVASTNTGMLNICCPGTTGDRMTEAQKRSLRWLLDNWHTTKVPKAYRAQRPVRGLQKRVHNQWPGQATACPGAMRGDYEEAW